MQTDNVVYKVDLFLKSHHLRSPVLVVGVTGLYHTIFHTFSFEYIHIQSVQEKLGFFTIHCNPSLAYIAVRDTVTPNGW